MNQSKLEVITCSRREARENACEQVTNGFNFTPDWIKNGASFFSQSRSVVSAKPIAVFIWVWKSNRYTIGLKKLAPFYFISVQSELKLIPIASHSRARVPSRLASATIHNSSITFQALLFKRLGCIGWYSCKVNAVNLMIFAPI